MPVVYIVNLGAPLKQLCRSTSPYACIYLGNVLLFTCYPTRKTLGEMFSCIWNARYKLLTNLAFLNIVMLATLT